MNSINLNYSTIKIITIAILTVASSSFLLSQEIIIDKGVNGSSERGEQIGLFSLEEREPKAFLGVMLRESEDFDGMEIVEFTGESAVEKAGIPVGARLLTLNKLPIKSIDHLLELLSKKRPGEIVSLRYVFNDEAKTAEVILGERPVSQLEEKVIIKNEKGKKDDGGGRGSNYAPVDKRVIIRGIPHAESRGAGVQNDLNIETISIERGFQNGDLHLKFGGVTGKVDVVLRKENGQVVERIVYEDLNGEFEHHFTLGSGAQGVYYLQINQGEKTYAERIYF